jgi:membrane protease YdiL (CAAX protease family)
VLAGICALVAHQAVVGRLDTFPSSLAQIVHPANISYGIQILGEDLGIAMLLASLLRKIRPRTAVIATGLLFAAGHVPAMVTGGAVGPEFLRLIADGLLAAAVVAVLLRMRDVWVLWPVHVAMDLTQFLH